MYPELFRIGDFVVSSYGAMLVVAFLASYFQLSWGLGRTGAGNEEDASALVFAAGLAGIAGAKIYYAVLYRDPGALLERSGLVWYGGFLAGAAAFVWVLNRRRLPVWGTLDAAAPALALGYALGRVGCFLVGDDYGMPTDGPLGVRFPRGAPPSRADILQRDFGVEVPAGTPGNTVLAVHPTQLYETALALLIWGVGLWLLRGQTEDNAEGSSSAKSGKTTLVVLALLAVERFGIEFLRAKDDRLLGIFTVAQLISLLILLILGGLALSRRAKMAGAAASGGAAGAP